MCFADVRHRLLVASLERGTERSLESLVKDRNVLHFAPEAGVGRCFSEGAASYKTADLLDEGYSYDKIDLEFDISAMPDVEDESFDLVVACDVLEHVPDDRAAMREVLRVLRPGGFAILTVPQVDGLAETKEDPSATTPDLREELFGQRDHVRMYGDDFCARLTSEGFKVSAIDAGSFPPALVRRQVLAPPKPSPHPMATNSRRIYFCQKSPD